MRKFNQCPFCLQIVLLMYMETNQLSRFTELIPRYAGLQPAQVLLCTHSILSSKNYRAGAWICLIYCALPPPAAISNEVVQCALKSNICQQMQWGHCVHANCYASRWAIGFLAMAQQLRWPPIIGDEYLKTHLKNGSQSLKRNHEKDLKMNANNKSGIV